MTKPLMRARDIAKKIGDLLSEITVDNGYETDIGKTVFRGRRKIDDDHVPCSVVVEGEDKPGGTQGDASQQVRQSYVIGGYAPCDPDHPNDVAHQIISDIKRVIFTTPKNLTRMQELQGMTSLGIKAAKIEYMGRDIGPRADGVPVVFAVVHVDVTFVEQLTNA